MSRSLNFQFSDDQVVGAVMKVIGVGGAGGNAVDRMVVSGLTGVEFMSINTDLQALDRNMASQKFQIGKLMTRGRGAGADPETGRKAAEQDSEIIAESIKGADLVFITAGMGGGTGTGAAPRIAQIAREQNALTVGIVTKPFLFEGKRRMLVAEAGIKELREHVDTLVVIPNQRLMEIVESKTSLLDAFETADIVLTQTTKGISDLISKTGIVNLDFADVRTIMSEGGDALMGMGSARGEDRGTEAAMMALKCPLLEEVSIQGALGVLVNITGSSEMTLFEVNDAATAIYEAAGERANVIFGAVVDDSLGDELCVTVIATGFDAGAGSNNGNGRRENVESIMNSSTRKSAQADYQVNGTKNPGSRQRVTEGAIGNHSQGNFRSKGNGSGERIHLGEIDISGEPPRDLNLPAFLRRIKN